MKRTTNYLNNKDLLSEIHKSKNSFSSFLKKEYHQYDIIVTDIDDITADTINIAKENHLKRNIQIDKDLTLDSIDKTQLIFRVMTYDHIPDAPLRKKTVKTVADRKEKLNFPPFQHWKFNEIGQLVCVGKSHWKGDLETGQFCKTHGRITNELGKMFIKLCEKYATRGNLRSYTYNDEMICQAIVQLVQVGLQFNENASDIPNPFAYLTSCLSNAMTRVINIEDRMQNIRDDILQMNGLNPSYTRMLDNEHEVALKHNGDHDESF